MCSRTYHGIPGGANLTQLHQAKLLLKQYDELPSLDKNLPAMAARARFREHRHTRHVGWKLVRRPPS